MKSSPDGKAIAAAILQKTLLACVLIFSATPGHGQQPAVTSGMQARIIQLGGPQSAAPADPLAVLWSPAALAALRDTQIFLNAVDPYSLSFLGASSHAPLLGTFAIGISRIPSAGSSAKRISLGWARHVGRRLSAGASLHGSRVRDETFFSGTFGVQVHSPVPGTLAEYFPTTGAFFNPTILPHRYAAGLHIKEIRFGQKLYDTTYNLGAAIRLAKPGPSIFASIDFRNDDSTPRVGLSVPLLSRFMLNAGVDDFKAKQAAVGATFVSSNYNLDMAYSFQTNKLLLSFGFRLSAAPPVIARSHLERGSALAKNGEYRKALGEMRRYLVFEPDNATTAQVAKLLSDRIEKENRQIKTLMREAAQYEKKSYNVIAARNYLKVLELDKNNTAARKRLMANESKVDSLINQMFTLGVQFFNASNLPLARRAFENILLFRKDYPQGRDYLQRIVDIQNKEAEEHYLRGLGYYSQRNYPKSIEAFQQALSLNADYAEAQKYLELAQKRIAAQQNEVARLIAEAERLTRRQNFPAAMQRYQQALAIEPANQAAQEQAQRLEDRVKGYIAEKLQAGERAFQRGNNEQAAEYFRQVLSTSPRDETAKSYLERMDQQQRQRIDEIFRRGMEQFDAKDYSRALTSFEEVLALDANQAIAKQKRQEAMAKIDIAQLFDRAKAFYQQNQFLRAMETFNQVLEKDPSNAASQRYLEDCQKQLELQVEKYFNQGMDFYAAEDYYEAVKMWDKALQINPNHAQSRSFKNKALKLIEALEQMR